MGGLLDARADLRGAARRLWDVVQNGDLASETAVVKRKDLEVVMITLAVQLRRAATPVAAPNNRD